MSEENTVAQWKARVAAAECALLEERNTVEALRIGLKLDAGEREALQQLREAKWDGNILSKASRDSLVKKGLVVRYRGWQTLTAFGLVVLVEMGELRS